MIGKVLTIAGSDPIGGAGIQADIKTITMNGCYAMSVITALTVQNTLGVTDVLDVPPDFLAAQIDAVFTDIFPDAVKIGMVSNAGTIRVIAEKLRCYQPAHIVIDPVMISSSGHALLREDAAAALCGELLPLGTLLTPNLPEASVLLGDEITGANQMKAAAQALSERFGAAVLLKGGHLDGAASDILYADGTFHVFVGERIHTPNTHGTGCTLSAAIASGLASGNSLPESVGIAKRYLMEALSTGFDIGKGCGPLLHNFSIAEP